LTLRSASCSVGGGGAGAHEDTADTWAVAGDLDLHVALVTPGGAPGVSHDPVLDAVLDTPAGKTGGVIELSAALLRVEDSGLVGLEDGLVSLNGGVLRGGGEGGLELGNAVGGVVLVVEDLTLPSAVAWQLPAFLVVPET